MSGPRSIWDGEDDGEDDGREGEAPWFVRPAEDDDAPTAPVPVGDVAAALAGVREAVAAEAGALYEVGRLIGRLEEAMRQGAIRDEAPAERLRAMEISDLMWRAGRAVRPEKLALYEIDGGVARGDAPEDYALACWALRRLRAPLDLASPATLRAWLGWGARRADLPAPLRPVLPDFDGEAVDAALARWLAFRNVAAALPAPARAGVLAAVWAATPEFGPDREIAASVLGARLVVEGEVYADRPPPRAPAQPPTLSDPVGGPAGARGGGWSGEQPLTFVPVSIGAGRRSAFAFGHAGDLAAAIPAWLAGIRAATERALAELAALDAWRARARAHAAPLRARVPGRLIGPLGDHLALSAKAAATLAGCSQEAADMNLVRLEEAGLAREITGAARWRFWTARL